MSIIIPDPIDTKGADDWDAEEIARQVAALPEGGQRAVRALFRGFRERTITADEVGERQTDGGSEAVTALLVERRLLAWPWHCPPWCTVSDEAHAKELAGQTPGRLSVTHVSLIDEGPLAKLAVRIESREAIDPEGESDPSAIVIGEDEVSPKSVRRVIENLEAALADIGAATTLETPASGAHFAWCAEHDDEIDSCVSLATDIARRPDGAITLALWIHEQDGRPVIAVDAASGCDVTPEEAQALAAALPGLVATARVGR